MGDKGSLSSLSHRVADFVTQREWEVFHNPKDLAIALLVEASELLELFQWRSREEVAVVLPEIRREIAEELADVFIYGLSMANSLSIDLEKAILQKLEENESRFPVERFRGRAYE